jgi:hypothetical protein
MQFITNLVGWNVLTQVALIVCYFFYYDLLKILYVAHGLNKGYFYFVVTAFLTLLWLAWTLISYVFGIRKLGAQIKRVKLYEGEPR